MPNRFPSKILFILILLLAGKVCRAQPQLVTPVSLKAGLSGARIAGDSFKPRPGYHWQISLYMPFSQSTHLVIGLEYIRAKAFLGNRTIFYRESHKLRYGDIQMSARFLEFSLHLSHTFPVSDRYKFGVFFGPALSGLLDTDDSHFHSKSEKTLDTNDEQIDYDYEIWEVDGTRDGGCSFHFGFTLAKNEYPTRYQYGLDFVVPCIPLNNSMPSILTNESGSAIFVSNTFCNPVITSNSSLTCSQTPV